MAKQILPGCDPADKIIKALGGLSAVAKAAGVTPTSVQRWRMPSHKGGTGGFVPRRYHDRLLEFAQTSGVELSRPDFVDFPVASGNAEPLRAAE